MPDIEEFKIGSKVVYPAHGVGRIVSIDYQQIAGQEIGMFVIDFPNDKMTLRVPVKRASISGLRVLSDERKLKEAMLVFKKRAKQERGMWSRRAQKYEEKINSGNIIHIAEVVRDLHKNVDDPDRSYSERVIYESALGRLASEYAAINELALPDATANLIEILKARKGVASNDDSVIGNNDNVINEVEEFEAA